MLFRATALSLMICYGTSAPAGFEASVIHRIGPASSLGIREPRPDARPSSGWFRMNVVPMSEFGASVQPLPEPAPGNRCGPHQFEVLNPWTGEDRCIGAP